MTRKSSLAILACLAAAATVGCSTASKQPTPARPCPNRCCRPRPRREPRVRLQPVPAGIPFRGLPGPAHRRHRHGQHRGDLQGQEQGRDQVRQGFQRGHRRVELFRQPGLRRHHHRPARRHQFRLVRGHRQQLPGQGLDRKQVQGQGRDQARVRRQRHHRLPGGVHPARRGDADRGRARETRVNDENQIIVVKGLVRPTDIDPDNSVPSTALADCKIEYYGEGVLADRQKPGWLSRLLDNVWPF